MSRLNRQVEYGLMALKVIASKKPGEKTTAKEVADLTGSPFDPTARVLQQMKQKGFLNAEQGAQGGYVLKADLASLSFFEFSEALLGATPVVRCLQHEEDCDLKLSCNIIGPIRALNQKMEQFYKSLNLAEILRMGVPQ